MANLEHEISPWFRLPDPPTRVIGVPTERDPGYVGRAVPLNDSEFILSFCPDIPDIKYNVVTKDWTDVDTHSSKNMLVRDGYFISMNRSRNELFLFEGRTGGNARTVSIRDMSTNQWGTLAEECKYAKEVVDTSYSDAVFVNGVCHFFVAFGPYSHKHRMRHFILDQDAGLFTEISWISMRLRVNQHPHDFKLIPIFVSRMNSILMIQAGGTLRFGGIWRYPLDDAGEWHRVHGVSIPIDFATAILTFDEKYILMADCDYILVLDISDENDFKLMRSDIGTPVMRCDRSTRREYDTMVRMGSGMNNEKLVIGWTKRLFEKDGFEELALPPLYLLQMIAKWLLCEQIHYIHRHANCVDKPQAHFMIPMKKILASKLTKIECDDP